MHLGFDIFAAANAEVFVLGMLCLILLVDLFVRDERLGLPYILSLVTLVGATYITAFHSPPGKIVTLGGTFVSDPLADVLKIFCYVTMFVVFLYSRDYLEKRGLLKGEFFVLALSGLLGVMVMISAHSMLTMYLGLELMSLSLYALVAFDRDSPVAAEAAMKYFVLGAIASGTLLYGISMIYGVTGTFDFGEIAAKLPMGDRAQPILLIGLVFVLVGIAFKFGAVPFHMWLPDVYHGAPTAMTLYIGSVPKFAALAMAVRILSEGLIDLHGSWQDMLIVLAVLSAALGNVVAIAQTNIKRMLAYSTISHVGFILLGIMTGTSQGLQAALFYTVTYVLMAVAAFGMVILLSRRGFEAENLADFKGLNTRSPWFASMMLIVMFSMAGVPPFVGFYAKVAIFSAVLDAGFPLVAALVIALTVIGAFYYLRVVKLMYFDEPSDNARIEAGADLRLVLSINGLAVLVLGLFPGGLIALCSRVIG